jgi:hypothetical protein
MKILDMNIGQSAYTQLDRRVLAVLCRRVDGWCIYVGAVNGIDHANEWRDVATLGTKVKEMAALAIAATYFHPGFCATGVDYAR